jgi:hypothetical protein
MPKQIIWLAAIAAMSAYGTLATQTQAPVENYQWSGELVSFDAATMIATIKARLVDQEAVADLKRFKVGDRVNLWWSGYDTYADAIRRVLSPSDRKDERFLLAAELASTEAPNQYVTFRVRVPHSKVSAVTSIKPAEWVTVTSPHRASGDSNAVVSIRSYVTASAASTD